LSQILGKISQPHHDNRQADNIGDMNPAVEHPREDDGKNSTDDSSDNKNLELIQFIGLYDGFYSENNYYITWQQASMPSFFLISMNQFAIKIL